MAPPRPSRRLTLAAASWVLLAVASLVVISRAQRSVEALILGLGVALATAAAALVTSRSAPLYTALAAVAAAAVVAHPGGPPAGEVLAVGLLLLVAAELGSWSFEHRVRTAHEPGIDRRRWLATAAVAVAGAAASAGVLLVAAAGAPTGALLHVAAAAAVVAAALTIRSALTRG